MMLIVLGIMPIVAFIYLGVNDITLTQEMQAAGNNVDSWTGGVVGSTLSVAVLLTFFWQRYSGIGVIATILSGLIGTLIWINTPLDEIISARFTTFFIALLFGVAFSLMFPEKHEEESQPEEINS